MPTPFPNHPNYVGYDATQPRRRQLRETRLVWPPGFEQLKATLGAFGVKTSSFDTQEDARKTAIKLFNLNKDLTLQETQDTVAMMTKKTRTALARARFHLAVNPKNRA